MHAPAAMLRHMFIYPIKSLGGVAVTAAQVEPRGFQYDRRWMLVDAESTGTFAGPEPLKTLADCRLHDGKVMFGQLLLSATLGTVHIGDAVTVIAYKEA